MPDNFYDENVKTQDDLKPNNTYNYYKASITIYEHSRQVDVHRSFFFYCFFNFYCYL